MPKVNSKILYWARKTSGLTLEEAAKKLKIKDSSDLLASEKLDSLENGLQEPSRALLKKMAKYYRRPLLVFYMSAPPRKGDRGQDFRTLPDDYSETDNFLIDTLIRDVRARQSIVKANLEEEDEYEKLNFIGSAKISDSINTLINSINKILNFDLKEFRAQPNTNEAFSLLRTRVEESGIFVLLIGNLGSHHTTIDVDIFRGFALADNIAPFIIINDQDSHSAWSFTLIHELVHLLLGQTGISGGKSELSIERFCNQVAGEFLLPTDELNKISINIPHSLEKLQLIISQFAQERNISSSMVAYRLYLLEKIDYNIWTILNDSFRDMWLNKRIERRKKARASEGGPSYYVIRHHRIGTPLIKLVESMMATGSLSTSKAGKVLGIKTKNVQLLLDTIHPGNIAFGA